MSRAIRVVDARSETAHADWLRHVYAFYLHDLSQFAPDEYRLSDSGHWEPDHLPYWLSEPNVHPRLLLSDAVPVGFAFVGESPFPFMSPGVRFRLTEFFVLRACRRSGVGRAAALAVLAEFRGSFELEVLEANVPALSFWRSVLPLVAGAGVIESSLPGTVRFSFATA